MNSLIDPSPIDPSRVVVFLGPSLPRRLVPETAKTFDLRPPAGQGDVLRAVSGGAKAVGIIDGYFEEVPAVWHKEILYALSQGAAVFGAASMGALRAAELHPFGMVGVGAVFEAYRKGVWEDDDEVAVIHGPAELGYPALSEAMANIRATLACAAAEDVLSPERAEALIGVAKAAPYADRNLDLVLAAADEDERGRLAAWLPVGRVDQKRLDALDCLRTLIDWRERGAPPPDVRFHFERTTLFDQAFNRIASGAESGPSS